MFLISSLTLHVRLSRRWVFFCQSLTEINNGREVKLCTQIGSGHNVSMTLGFRCVDFRKWFQPRDQKDPKPARKGIALNLDQWVRMRKLVEAINNDHPVLATALPCYMQEGHLATFELELCADELVVGGGVGRCYDRRRRRAANFFIGGCGGVALWSAWRRQTG